MLNIHANTYPQFKHGRELRYNMHIHIMQDTPSNTQLPVSAPPTLQPADTALLGHSVKHFHKRPLLFFTLFLGIIVLTLVAYASFASPQARAKRKADALLAVLSSTDVTQVDTLEESGIAFIKDFFLGAQQQLQGKRSVSQISKDDSGYHVFYTFTDALVSQAEVLVTNDITMRISAIVFGSDDAKTTYTPQTTSPDQAIYQSRKENGYACLEQSDYARSNFNPDEQDVLNWSKTFEPTSSIANKTMSIFFKNGSLEPESSIDYYSGLTRFANEFPTKQWEFHIRATLLESSTNSIREKQDLYLANKRALLIRDKLRNNGVPEDRIVVEEAHISTTEFSEENKAIPQRVDIVIDPTCI